MEKVEDLMTKNPALCTPDNTLEDVAQLMVKYDCGELPVVSASEFKQLVGVITDRDICCRSLGQGKDPSKMTVAEVMTSPAVSIAPNATLEDCCKIMERNRIRRIPVVNEFGVVCGIVTLSDITKARGGSILEIMQEISKTKAVSL